MPWIRASFGLVSVPLAHTTNRARMWSPRSVRTCHSCSSSSQMVDVTVVWNIASS